MYLNVLLSVSFLLNIAAYERTFNACHDFKLLNGKMRIKPKGKLAKFHCNKGYMLAGEKYSYCIKGQFDVPPPVCVKPTCTQLKQFTNGLILPAYNGAVMNFYCKPGFTMRGTNISYCDGNRWSHNLPACISTHLTTPTTCDFETEDLCGWSHDLNHDFDWRRQNFQTPSGHIGTGPRYDHTKGPKNDGYYMYIESTSRLENDTARLLSPFFPPHRTLCFTFWYHMYGRDMGRLNIYIRRESEQGWGTVRGMKPLWTQQGNLGDVWRKGKIEIEEGISENFQIVIEGVRGSSYISDLAIDDVELTEICPDDDIFSSTTEMTTEEEPDILFGSCIDRCNENNTEIILSDSGSCECNDNCYERNTCCPDYSIVCLQMAIDDFSTDYTDNYYSTTEIEPEMRFITQTSTKKQQITTIEDLKDVTTAIPSKNDVSTAMTFKNHISTQLTTNPTTITTLPTTITTTFDVHSTIKSLPTSKKIIPPTTDVSTIETTQQTLKIETDYLPTTEKLILETPEILMQKDNIENNSNLTLIVGISGVAILCAIVAVVIFIKFNRKCRRLRDSRNSDSMSDVRFLASDEVLDFTWKSSSDI